MGLMLKYWPPVQGRAPVRQISFVPECCSPGPAGMMNSACGFWRIDKKLGQSALVCQASHVPQSSPITMALVSSCLAMHHAYGHNAQVLASCSKRASCLPSWPCLRGLALKSHMHQPCLSGDALMGSISCHGCSTKVQASCCKRSCLSAKPVVSWAIESHRHYTPLSNAATRLFQHALC